MIGKGFYRWKKLKSPRKILIEYRKWKDDWEDLCDQCGKCCYTRSPSFKGDVEIDYSKPCKFLDTESNLCVVYNYRFDACDYCGKVNLFRAVFSPYLPSTCAYVRTFR